MYAGFWKRAIAFIADMILVALIYVPFYIYFDVQPDELFFFLGVPFLISVVYFSLLEASPLQATFGKKMLGVIVVDENGAKLNLKKAFLRNLGKAVSYLTLNTGFALAGLTVNKQALHDIMAKCLVINKAAKGMSLGPLPEVPVLNKILILGVLVAAQAIAFFILHGKYTTIEEIYEPDPEGYGVSDGPVSVEEALTLKPEEITLRTLKAISESQKRYKAQNGEYADEFEKLDVPFDDPEGNSGRGKDSMLFGQDFRLGKRSAIAVKSNEDGSIKHLITGCYESSDKCCTGGPEGCGPFKLKIVVSPRDCCLSTINTAAPARAAAQANAQQIIAEERQTAAQGAEQYQTMPAPVARPAPQGVNKVIAEERQTAAQGAEQYQTLPAPQADSDSEF